MDRLNPTLWRTCRALANPIRLDLIRELMNGATQSVTQLADKTGLSEGVASSYLRTINSRGLIQAKPNGRYVFYSATPNPNVEHSAELLEALDRAFTDKMDNEAIIHVLTAFTHERRLEIIATMEEKRMSLIELTVSTGISGAALLRHLKKLRDRGIVKVSDRIYRLTTPEHAFARTLLLVAQGKVVGP
jgi:DNA-binding transcriptional ArsR family regulator